jgi:hypothetical protein
MKINKFSWILATGLLSGYAQANTGEIEIQSFRLARQSQEAGQGQAQMEVAVTQTATQEILVRTLSCNQQLLSAEQQEQTQFILTGEQALQAQAVLQNQARLASEQAIVSPSQQNPHQMTLEVVYRYQSAGSAQEAIAKIQSPLVIIGNQVSSVLETIEQQARASAQESCDH